MCFLFALYISFPPRVAFTSLVQPVTLPTVNSRIEGRMAGESQRVMLNRKAKYENVEAKHATSRHLDVVQ